MSYVIHEQDIDRVDAGVLMKLGDALARETVALLESLRVRNVLNRACEIEGLTYGPDLTEQLWAVAEYVTNVDALDEIWAIQRNIGITIRKLESVGRFAAPLAALFRFLQILVERRIQRVLNLSRSPRYMQVLVLIELDFFKLNGSGRPPTSRGQALNAGLSLLTGRMCSGPAFA